MTMWRADKDHESALWRVANEYEDQGYHVTVRPTARERPSFLSAFAPALIAARPDESVVVEIATRDRLIGNHGLVALASAIEAEPGWRFALIVVAPHASGE
jgi:hypothetical protein